MRFDALPEINPNGPTGERPFDGGEPRSLWDDGQKWDMDYINSLLMFTGCRFSAAPRFILRTLTFIVDPDKCISRFAAAC